MDWFHALFIGVGVSAEWIALKYSGFQNKRWHFLYTLQRPRIWWLIFVGLILGTVMGALLAGRSDELTNEDVVEEVKNTGAEVAEEVVRALTKRLNEIESKEEDELQKKYPLGYVLLASSGQHKAVVYDRSRIRGDFNDIRMYHNNRGSFVIHTPTLRIQPGDLGPAIVQGNVIELAPEVGLSAGFRFGRIGMECEILQAKPIGLCAVIGFKEAD